MTLLSQIRLVEQEDGPGRLHEQEECPSRLQLPSQEGLVDDEQKDGPGRLKLPSLIRLVEQEDGPGRLYEQEICPRSLQLPSQIRLVGPIRLQHPSQRGLGICDGQDDGDGTTETTIEQLPEMHKESPQIRPEEGPRY